MNDKDYFSEYKRSFHMIFATNHFAFIKDADFKYQSVTNKMVEHMGAETPEIMLGKTIAEMIPFISISDLNLVKQWQQQDLLIQQDRTSKTYLEVMSYNGKNQIHILNKSPIINPETDNFVGILGRVNDLLMPHIIKTLFKMHGGKGLLSGLKNNNKNPLVEYPLNDIQHMVLFLAINNYSYSEISIWLSEFGHEVSPGRVNDYLEQLKLIFHVKNKTQLIEKCIGLNLHSYLPEGLFTKESSMEISNEETAFICNSSNNQY